MKRPSRGTLEVRAAPAAAPAPKVEGNKLVGLIPFGIESRDLGGFTESLSPGCLDKATTDDLVCVVNHDVSRILGRHPTTLAIEQRDDGLAWECELPNGPTGQDVREAVKRGDLRATSWQMVVGEDRWEGDRRIIDTISELREVGPVTTAAYPTVAELRSKPEPPAIEQPAEPASKETEMRDRESSGTLVVEDRAAETKKSVEQRMVESAHSTRPGECRSLTLSSASPISREELTEDLYDKLRAGPSVMLSTGIRVVTTDRDQIVWPRLTSDVAADFYAETEQIATSDPVFAEMTATPHKLAVRVELSNEVISDSHPSILDVLSRHVPEMMGLALDKALLVGNPTSNADSIRGLKFVSGIQEVNAATNGSPLEDFDPFLKAIGLLVAANVPPPFAIVAHPRLVTELSLLKDETTSARQLGIPAGFPPLFATTQLPVDETQGSANNATSAYVFAPDRLILVRRQDTEVELDRSRLFDKDMSEVRAKLRADLLVPDPVSVVRIKGLVPPA